jgi:hypothetical protein
MRERLLLPCSYFMWMVMSLVGCTVELPQRLLSDVDAIVAFGAREYASDGLHASAEHMRRRLESVGATVTVINVPMPRYETLEATLLASSGVTVDANTFLSRASLQSLAFTGDGDVEALLLDAGDGRGGAYSESDAAGRVLLVRTTATSNLLTIYELAVERGAAALLWESDEPSAQSRTAWKPDAHAQVRGPLPTVSMTGDDAAALRAALTRGDVTIALHVRGVATTTTAPAVVARVRGTEHAGQAIVVDAHLDAWHVGANDNATGLAALIELAQRVHAQPLAYDVVFAAFPGQEIGFFGSSQFVRDSVAGDVRFAITIDMLAPLDPSLRLAAFDPFRTGATPSPVLSAFTATPLNELFSLQMSASELRMTAGGVNTDHASFWDAGIAGVFLACLGWPGFHTDADTVDRIDVNRLVAVTDGLDAFLRELATLSPDDLGARPASWIPVNATVPDALRAGTITLAPPGDGIPLPDNVRVRVLASDEARTVLLEHDATQISNEGFSYVLDDTARAATWMRAEASNSTASGVQWIPLESQ